MEQNLVFHIIAHVLSIGDADPAVPLPDTGASGEEQDWDDATVGLIASCCVVAGLMIGMYLGRCMMPSSPRSTDPEQQRLLSYAQPRTTREGITISGEI